MKVFDLTTIITTNEMGCHVAIWEASRSLLPHLKLLYTNKQTNPVHTPAAELIPIKKIITQIIGIIMQKLEKNLNLGHLHLLIKITNLATSVKVGPIMYVRAFCRPMNIFFKNI